MRGMQGTSHIFQGLFSATRFPYIWRDGEKMMVTIIGRIAVTLNLKV